MSVTITINTDEATTDELKAVRAFVNTLLGEEAAPVIGAVEPVTVKPEAVRKETAKAKSATASAPQKAEPEPVVEPDPEPEPEEDLLGGDIDPKVLRETATGLATKLVSAGETPKVKAALVELGVKRVSELPDGKLQSFIDSLS